MAHFAELDGNNIVTRVIVISNNDCTREGVEAEEYGVAFCQQLFGGILFGNKLRPMEG